MDIEVEFLPTSATTLPRSGSQMTSLAASAQAALSREFPLFISLFFAFLIHFLLQLHLRLPLVVDGPLQRLLAVLTLRYVVFSLVVLLLLLIVCGVGEASCLRCCDQLCERACWGHESLRVEERGARGVRSRVSTKLRRPGGRARPCPIAVRWWRNAAERAVPHLRSGFARHATCQQSIARRPSRPWAYCCCTGSGVDHGAFRGEQRGRDETSNFWKQLTDSAHRSLPYVE